MELTTAEKRNRTKEKEIQTYQTWARTAICVLCLGIAASAPLAMSAGCGSDCKLLPKSAVDVCLASLAADGGACERCECEHCGGEVSACVASGQAQRDARCLAVEQCATDNDCAGNTCYCGSALLLCALEPLGACVPQIEQAAGTHSWITIQAQFLDSGSALGRAQTLGECRRDHCSNVCP